MDDERKRMFRDAHQDVETARGIPDTPQTRSPSYRLAFNDPDFLYRDELRPVRLQLELLKPEMLMSEMEIVSTVVLFGGARIPAPAHKDAARTETLAGLSHFYDVARDFAKILTERSLAEGNGENVIVTGGNQPGDRFTEGYAGFEYLRFAGIPEAELLVVTDGESTYEQLAATARQLRARDLGSAVLVSDPYHALRLRQIADQVGLDATVSSTDGGTSLRQLLRETAGVSLGRILGYRRVDNWLGRVG